MSRPRRRVVSTPTASSSELPKAPTPPTPPAGPITFVIPGQSLTGSSDGVGTGAAVRGAAAGSAPGWRGQVKAAVRLGLQRDGGQVQRVQAQPGEDVVVLHLVNGPTLVLHPESARDLMLAQGRRTRGAGDAAPGEVEVPATLRWQGLEAPALATRGATRGFLGDVLLAMVEIVVGPVQDAAQDWAAERIGCKVDDQVDEGVYRLQPERLDPLKGRPKVDATMPAAPDGGPTLVFVHGTFSDTVSGFGKLWELHPQRVAGLFEHYGRRVYALDHATLRRSPIDNALTLARCTPQGARLHLVTHSRGGLVAEVLARAAGLAAGQRVGQGAGAAALDEAADECFRVEALPGKHVAALNAAQRREVQDALDAQKRTLAELIGLLRERDIRIERVVRVACPARGTLLASGRFDAFLSIFKWALDLAQVPVAPALLEFIAGVAQRREDPAVLPGLAAMVPDSPLIRWLHAAQAPVPGQLRVIAGDLEGDSIGSWVKTLVSDAFYWTDHDLVVQTRSMYGGAAREADAAFVLDRGGKVNHFNYFANGRTVDALVDALQHDRPAGWRPIGPLSAAGESATGTRAARRVKTARDGASPAPADLPAVFVLPGILGSHLKVDGKRIWLGWRLVNGLSRLEYRAGRTKPRVEPDGPVGNVYDDLIDFLEDSHQVIEFAFDWRVPIEQEARRLGQAVQDALDARAASGQPVRIVAHSMGGVLARTMQLECPRIWERMMVHPQARMLMLGTPNGGSWAPMQCLSGDDPFGNLLVTFGAPFQDKAARQLMAEFPGFLQLQAGLLDEAMGLATTRKWEQLAKDDLAQIRQHNWWHQDERQIDACTWGVPPQEVLDQAKALRLRLDAQRERELPNWAGKLLLVVGRSRFTPDGYEVGPEGLVYLNADEAGDGRVTRASAMLPGVRTWQVDVEHGDLPDASDHYDAFLELLTAGSTAKLDALPTQVITRGAGAAAAPAVVHVRSRPSRERSGAPTPQDLLGARPLAAAAAARSEPGAAAAALHVTVLNGDLKFVRQPLMLGHYTANQLTGTERVVDDLIGGTMRQSLALRQYPDQPGTHQFFANNLRRSDNPLQMPCPESVIVVGMGPEGSLRLSELTYTVRLGVLAVAQRVRELPDRLPLGFELAATLLGSGGAGISVGQAAQAIAQGVREADEALAELNNRLEQAAGEAAQAWPRVARLKLIELYMSRATEAWRALQLQSEASPGRYALCEAVQIGTGGLPRPLDSGYRGSSYDYIRALGRTGRQGEATIDYTIDTRKRARTEKLEHGVQAPLLRSLVAEASNDRNRDGQIGRTLFNLLVPVEMGSYLGGSSELLLQLDSTTAGVPWELLDNDRAAEGAGADRPWAIRSKLLRTLVTTDHRRQVIDAGADAQVLVIGEPDCDAARFPRLPGARAEARSVTALLAGPNGLPPERVVGLVREDDESPGPAAREVINALMSRDWRIVHIAGHGMPPEDQEADGAWGDPTAATAQAAAPARNPRGVVLSSGTYLGPNEIRSMRVVPELVFVNCCHLAARASEQLLADQRYDRSRFASGVAEALIGIGVRCVVAAGWAVEDEPASRFATTFYQSLLRGMRFIDAVAQAREAAWQPGSNTWAAYQCYGDPDWMLQRSGGDPQKPAASLADEYSGVTSAAALELALQTLEVECQHQARNKEKRRARIRHLQSRFGADWGRSGAVANAFGRAWDAAGDRDEAVSWYRRAVQAGDGRAPLKATEQLANLLVKRAWDRYRQAESEASAATEAATQPAGRRRAARKTPAGDQTRQTLDRALAQADREIDEALGLLDKLIALAPSQERHALRGSAYKRRVMIDRLADRADAQRRHLAEMVKAYDEAWAIGRRCQAADRFYPALNRLSAQAAQAGQATTKDSAQAPGAEPPVPLDAAEVTELRDLLERSVREAPDFWSVVGLTELTLYEAMVEGRLHAVQEAVAASYRDLFLRTRGNENWKSAADQLEFALYGLLNGRPSGERAAAQALIDLVKGFTRESGHSPA